MISAHIGDPYPWTTCSPRCTVCSTRPELMIKLHIGCFDVPFAGCYDTDITRHIVIARIPFLARLLHALGLIDARRCQQYRDGVFHKVHYLNTLKKFPSSDSGVDVAYPSCMLTNFTRQQAIACLKEITVSFAPMAFLVSPYPI